MSTLTKGQKKLNNNANDNFREIVDVAIAGAMLLICIGCIIVEIIHPSDVNTNSAEWSAICSMWAIGWYIARRNWYIHHEQE